MKDLTPEEDLIAEFVGLKNELLQKMTPDEHVYLWQDNEGHGVALGWNDTLFSKYEPKGTIGLGLCLPQDLIKFLKMQTEQSFSNEECLKVTNQRLKEILEAKQ